MTRLDRLDYVEGSRLLARDLGDTTRTEAQRLGLHVRGLHNTWGVATGLELTLVSNHRGVVVGAGSAFDCRGQVINLASPVELPVPAVVVPGVPVAAFDVVLDSRGPRWEPTGGGPGQPGFGSRVRPGMDIPLGRCLRMPWGEMTPPDRALRRTVHPLTRPRVGFGLTPAGGLSWVQTTWSIRTAVDTSAAGFGSTPHYTGWVANRPDMGGLIGPFLSLSSFYPDRFTIRLIATSPAGASALTVVADLETRAAAIRIAWVGVESNAGCSSNPPGGFV